MIDKRLIGMMGDSKRYIAKNVALQWLALAANVAMIFAVSRYLGALYDQLTIGDTMAGAPNLTLTLGIVAAALLVRAACTRGAAAASYNASRTVKKTLRSAIYEKLLRLGGSYTQAVPTAEVLQLAGEGVEQLETYFGAYLPQFFYAMLAPVTLFVVLAPVSVKAAVILMICVPLIPVSIVAVQKFAKRLLGKYWGQYAALGDSFLENLQGLTTLKIYQADGWKHEEMNRQAERFRKITMKVLTMQLNSVTLMDLMAYGGAGLGIISAVAAFAKGQITLTAALTILLLAADFFLPLRLLGSYFHIAMNGAASAEKIFRLLAADEPADGTQEAGEDTTLKLDHVTFGYGGETVLNDVTIDVPAGSTCAVMGATGTGKTSVVNLLGRFYECRQGAVTIDGADVKDMPLKSLRDRIGYVMQETFLFSESIENNIRFGRPEAPMDQVVAAAKAAEADEFIRQMPQGYDTIVGERGLGLSGGQKQRIAIARALLYDPAILVLDDSTSAVDMETEHEIQRHLKTVMKDRTTFIIAHRISSVKNADQILVLDKSGRIAERGTHDELLAKRGLYYDMYQDQYRDFESITSRPGFKITSAPKEVV